MAKRKAKPEFDAAQYSIAGTVRLPTDALKLDEQSRIIEAPVVLARFTALVKAINEATDHTIRLGKIRVVPGSYLTDIECVHGLSSGEDIIKALVEKLNEACRQLEINATRRTPERAGNCGVASATVGVLKAAGVLANDGHSIVFEAASEHQLELSGPSGNAISAIPPPPKKPLKVDAPITGLSVGDQRGVRLELAGKTMYPVRDLDLQTAISLVQRRCHITGRAIWDGERYVVESPTYADVLDI